MVTMADQVSLLGFQIATVSRHFHANNTNDNLIYEELLIPGDFALRGYYGPTSLYAKTTTGMVVGQCPGDHLYDERPNMIYDGSVVCNAVASSQIYLAKSNIQ